MPIFIAVAVFVYLAAVLSLHGYRRYARPARLLEHLAGGGPQKRNMSAGARLAGFLRMAGRVGNRLAPDEVRTDRLKRKLISAGYRSEKAPAVYTGVKLLLALWGAVLGLTVTLAFDFGAAAVAGAGIVCALAGMRLPELFLRSRIGKRRDGMNSALPDAVDLMVLCAESGVSLTDSIRNVSREMAGTHRALSEELKLACLEIDAGTRLSVALANFADRTNVPEVSKLTAVLIQTDRFGTSMVETLRGHADFMRVRRRQMAEERAGTVGIKLLFPIFLFILPATLLVTAGPALIQIFRNLGPALSGGF